jgi:hypothetical protein
MASQFVFRSPFARRLPDPIHPNIVRHILFVPATEMPQGLPLKPNARAPKINKQVYKEVERSLLNEEGTEGTFHLKHKGITLIADSVQPVGDSKDKFVVAIDENKDHGILDGGHSYALITKARDIELPENWVKVEILTEIPHDWIAEISGGLNTSVQVQAMSLDNLAGEFNWIKEILKNEPYYSKIAWRENDPGDVDARELISMMTLFLIDEYPNDSDKYPITAYERKLSALKLFEDKPELYKRVAPIMKDIFTLHDMITCSSQKYWNEKGGKFASLHFVETRKRGEFETTFTACKTPARLMNGALYPILGAFRAKVVKDDKGNYKWDGGFKAVTTLWEETAAELLRATYLEGQTVGLKADAIGKSRSHWPNVHRIVAFRDLQKKLES